MQNTNSILDRIYTSWRVVLNRNSVINSNGTMTAAEIAMGICAPIRHGKKRIDPTIEPFNAK